MAQPWRVTLVVTVAALTSSALHPGEAKASHYELHIPRKSEPVVVLAGKDSEATIELVWITIWIVNNPLN